MTHRDLTAAVRASELLSTSKEERNGVYPIRPKPPVVPVVKP